MTVALSRTRPALHDGVPSRMRVLTEAPPLPLKTLSEEREIGSPKRLLSSGQARPRPCPKRTTLTARRPALMARPAPRSAGSSTDPPAPCHAKPSSGGSRDTPSVDSSLLQPSYTPEGGLAFVTNCRPRHQTRDHHPINYPTSSTQTPPSLHQADVTSSSHAQRTGGVRLPLFFGWMDSTSVGPLVHDVPLRWPRVSPRVVVRRFHHERDDPPPAKVPGGRVVKSAQARQA